MSNVHLYAWLQVESIARGIENLITIFLFTPGELQWPEEIVRYKHNINDSC